MRLRDIPDWFTRHPMAGDAFWALVVMPLLLIGASGDGNSPVQGAAGLPLAAAILVPMLWRRRHPDVLAACAVLVHLFLLLTMDHFSALSVVVPIVLYAVAAYSKHRWYRVWLGIAIFGALAAGPRWSTTMLELPQRIVGLIFTTMFCLAVVAAAWVSGELARQRRHNVEALRERADALERERDQRTRLAAQEERSRIAREMHDIVAHNLSVIVVQADGAKYAATHGADPERRAATAAQALDTIAQTARDALAETRRLVGVLRSDGAETEYAPQASLAQLPELVARMNHAGLPTTYDEFGDPAAHPPLAQGAEMAAYRVVQEALTNVVKHAGHGVPVAVTLEHRPDGIALAVRDEGPGSGGNATGDGHGHGLVGMRERITTYGGTLTARDRMAGGFEVLATIPAREETR
ncbi:MAG: sensor histidine kinase [Austwickia sp.]|nr:MAG: sensor histidine kinase [Austwickia sp.]